MAQFELNTYGKDDEILNTFATDRVRWGVFMQALELDNVPVPRRYHTVTVARN